MKGATRNCEINSAITAKKEWNRNFEIIAENTDIKTMEKLKYFFKKGKGKGVPRQAEVAQGGSGFSRLSAL
jgi:hypothetical protein